MPETAARKRISQQRLYEESQKRIACAGAYAELYDKHDGTINDIHAMSSQCLSLHRDLVQYLADEALHLSASRKFAKEEKSQRRPLSVTGCSFRAPEGPFKPRGCSLYP